ncbi:hypothetical protein CHU95_16895 [Niveispirillum lacus]|uniref:Solute-binding protein family 3/N-terminal domain-containing protein n=1 Tax=Niveispirillum lacus TaxID=1981099 RepID=A0A255YVL6_9PROT|nr:transporter substrate-binding domain-containing protein [Niveispirillum lacus]OYQ32470.1 hypothetical protein CHU95_16895 [Niveispirillum lacus]
MNVSIRLFLAALAVVFVLAGAVAPVRGEGASACILRFAWTEFPPYQTLGADGKPSGIDVDLVNEIGRRMPCAIQWELAPRPRAVLLVQEGKVDAVVGVARTAERDTFGIYSPPVREGRNVLIVRKGATSRFAYDSLTALAGSAFRLGVVSGSRYSQEFEDLTRSGALADNVIPVQNGESAMAMLMRDRIDGFLDGHRTALSRAAQLGLADEIEVHPMFVSEHKAYVLFSRAAAVDPALITQFNAVLLGMQADGTLARIMTSYGS